MPTIFTRIINREIPAHIVSENDRFIAFLDINPLVLGHTLVVPKVEADYIFDLDDNTLGAILAFSKPIARAIATVVPCKRIGLSVIGLEVPHTHLHLVPMNSADDLNFTRKKLSPSSQALSDIAEKIKASF
ncbi:MAG TPA: HIT family protein [Chryseolinea sp.]|nr:HIT family protein [Chryseolinea sp.]